MAAKRTAAQRGLGAAGNKVWQAVNADYELSEHELAILRKICRTLDTLVDLQRQLDSDGIMIRMFLDDSAKQPASRMHPALAEICAQRLVLTKLVAALQLPSGLVEGLAPAADAKPKRTRRRKTQFSVVRAAPGMV